MMLADAESEYRNQGTYTSEGLNP